MPSEPNHDHLISNFISRWQASSAAERANYQLFLSELCDLLDVPRPNPTQSDDVDNAYVFERNVRFDHGDGQTSTGRIDLYKRNAFVLEAKQGSDAQTSNDLFLPLPGTPGRGLGRGAGGVTAPDRAATQRRGTATRGTPAWDTAMAKAKGQAEQYVRALPASEGNPPFIVVVDVGHTIELYADFSRLGKTYTPFPDSRSHRIPLAFLADESIRQRLAGVWTDPLSLDPSRHSAKVTRNVAEKLAKLARSLESTGHHAEVVAHFLMRCIFTFFAEDAGLIERDKLDEQPFTDLLKSLKGHPDQFVPFVQEVWARMDKGGFSAALRKKLKHFNGKLFKECNALPLSAQQLDLLIDAGVSDWSDVEPAIFGTLLERALDQRERHKLGAHYTPRAYVERLVLPTVIEPLREQFDAAKAAAFTLNFQGKPEEARKAVDDFLLKLCNTIVLDPACGSGNFLYVTMEHMKRLEGEARDLLKQLGETQEDLQRAGRTVDPHQFLGLEINPRAVAIAELVLWIGYLKWHLRTLGHAPTEPLLKDFHNIVEQDAVLAYDKKEIVTDETGKPVTRWDGHTMKLSPVTGEEIPDDAARVPVFRYLNSRKAEWPKADYTVGNPPFIGNKRMREALGGGYVEALRAAWDEVPSSADYVMYWWSFAAELIAKGALRRSGLITTNSITQTFNRRVIENASENKVGISFAIPDHPWVDSADGADVRVAMTVFEKGILEGGIHQVVSENPAEDGAFEVKFSDSKGEIHSDLTIGTNLNSAEQLKANKDICVQGVVPIGKGFIINAADVERFDVSHTTGLKDYIKRYRNGKDLTQTSRVALIIDLEGLTESEVRSRFPAIYQHILHTVKPERDQNNERYRRENWWKFGRKHTDLRNGLRGLSRYIATVKTAKHRLFMFLDGDIIPDSKLYAVALDDAFAVGVLSSRVHVTWATAVGGWLGVGNDPTYNNIDCFDKFPFPACTETQKQKIRDLGESLDAHRNRQQAAHPALTITDMYNVLEKLRALSPQSPGIAIPGSSQPQTALTPKEKQIHEQGLISVLKQIHDDLDAAVAAAYAWPASLTDEQILQKLVELNHERAQEERKGKIRYLRPEFQSKAHGSAVGEQTELALPKPKATKAKKAKATKLPWPPTLAEQAAAVRALLTARTIPENADAIARAFNRAPLPRVLELLETLAALGQIRVLENNRFAA